MKDLHEMQKTHRCEKSVKRGISIRYCNPYKHLKGITEYGDFRWWMLKNRHCFDSDSHYLQPISPIEYCPCCGCKLDGGSNEKN